MSRIYLKESRIARDAKTGRVRLRKVRVPTKLTWQIRLFNWTSSSWVTVKSYTPSVSADGDVWIRGSAGDAYANAQTARILLRVEHQLPQLASSEVLDSKYDFAQVVVVDQ